MESFLKYGYTPFRKSQCIIRLFALWGLSAFPCLIGPKSILWGVILGFINILTSVIFSALIVRYSLSMISRYLCDGIFCLHLSVILVLSSYRIIALESGPNSTLLAILLLLLLVCIIVFLCITYLNIKADKFSYTSATKGAAISPVLGSVFGILTVKVFLSSQSQHFIIITVAILLLLLSFIISIPSLNLLKAMLYVKNNQEPKTKNNR